MMTSDEILARLGLRQSDLALARGLEKRCVLLAFAGAAVSLCVLIASLDRAIALHWVWALLLSVVIVVPLVLLRDRKTAHRRRLESAVRWWERALKRRDDVWEFGQDDGSEYVDRNHPYTNDLDVFGPGSLFHRVNACVTVLGRDALAIWLQGEHQGPNFAERQAALLEILRDADWREQLEIELRSLEALGPDAVGEARELDEATRNLVSWGETETPPEDSLGQVSLSFLAPIAFGVAIVLMCVLGWPFATLLPFYALNVILLSRVGDLDRLMERCERIERTLGAWSRVLLHVEGGPKECAVLAENRRLLAGQEPASGAVRRLHRWTQRFSYRRNWVWACTFGVLLLWDLHVRRALLRWKRIHGPTMRAWFVATARAEAWSALASYIEAVPDHALPVATSEAPLEARGLAHPLLPCRVRVGNDLAVDHVGSIHIVTGSNMSGKSTFLRSVGLAVVMSRCGLPVAASAFRLRDMEVLTCMRVQDDLGKGSSQFHAEVTRLKYCVDRAARAGLSLVLLDEILGGTNSEERHVGALAVLRSLARLPTVNFVSTHDLGLAGIAEELPDRTKIVHFRDDVERGRMTFDYVMRSGPVPSTNALRVMRLAGLEVPE